MPRKVAIPVLGVAALLVVVMLLRRRGSQGATAATPGEPGGFTGAIGGGGYTTPSLGEIITSTPVNPWQNARERLEFEKEQFDYNITQRKESERQREFEIRFEEERSTLDKFLELLPFQFETQRQREASLAAGYQADTARAGAEAEFFRTAEAAQKVITRHTETKKKVECPPGMHLVVTPESGATCQPLGGGGFNPATIIRGVGNFLEGFIGGAVGVAPSLGAGAAQYGAAQIGIIPGGTSSRARPGTPGINPEPRDAYPYAGSTIPQYGGLA